MSRFGRYVREKVVKVLVTALVVGSVAGNEGITVQAAGAKLNDPFSFVLYTNYTRMNLYPQIWTILREMPQLKN